MMIIHHIPFPVSVDGTGTAGLQWEWALEWGAAASNSAKVEYYVSRKK